MISGYKRNINLKIIYYIIWISTLPVKKISELFPSYEQGIGVG